MSHCYNITKQGEGWRVWVKRRADSARGEKGGPFPYFTVRPNGDCDWGSGEHIMTLEQAKTAVGINRALWSTLHP